MQHGTGLDPGRVIDRQAIEYIHPNVPEVRSQGFQHGAALPQAEQRVLVRIPQDRDNQLVEDLAAAVNQIQVPVGRGIERAGIDGNDLLQESSIFLTDNRQARVKEDSMRQG